MAIRIRDRGDGQLIALCAAKTNPEEGDLYLDDDIHYTLSQKYWRDYDEIKVVDDVDVAYANILEAEIALKADYIKRLEAELEEAKEK